MRLTRYEILTAYAHGVRDFSGVDLRRADLSYADLGDADLSDARLSDAYLDDADLSDANLSGADLSDVYLISADLSDANLRDADLRGARLQHTVLLRACLSGVDLRCAKYSIPQVLLAAHGRLSEYLTLECMRWDATLLPDPTAMDRWAFQGGRCPCPGRGGTVRIINFNERADLWQPGAPEMTLRQLWAAIAEEKGIRI